MQESLEQHASTLKATQRWWVVVIEGIVAIVIGLFIVAFPANASDAIRTLIAIALLVVSLGQIVEGFRFRNRPGSPWATLLGGVGVTAAGLTLLAPYSAYIEPSGARQMLAVGLVAFGIVGLLGLIFTIRSAGSKLAALILDVLAIAIGVLLFMADASDSGGTQLVGAAAVIGGVALLIYGYFLWNKGRAPRTDLAPEHERRDASA